MLKYNTGFKTVYEINQVNLIGVNFHSSIIFDAEVSPGEEKGYLTMGKNMIFDTSKYPSNIFFNPRGAGMTFMGSDQAQLTNWE